MAAPAAGEAPTPRVAAPSADQRGAGGHAPPDRDRGIDALDHAGKPPRPASLQRLVEGHARRGPRRGGRSRPPSARPPGSPSSATTFQVVLRRAEGAPQRPQSVGHVVDDQGRRGSAAGESQVPGQGRVSDARPAPAAPAVSAREQSGEAVEKLLLVDSSDGARGLEPIRDPLGCLVLALGARQRARAAPAPRRPREASPRRRA